MFVMILGTLAAVFRATVDASRLCVGVENNFVFQPLLAAGIEVKKVLGRLKDEYWNRPWGWQAIW